MSQRNSIFWDVIPCILMEFNPRFGRTYRIHLQGLIVSQEGNQTETAGKPSRQKSLYFVLTIHFPRFVFLRFQYLFSFSFPLPSANLCRALSKQGTGAWKWFNLFNVWSLLSLSMGIACWVSPRESCYLNGAGRFKILTGGSKNRFVVFKTLHTAVF